MEAATAATEEGGMEAGRGNCCWEFMCSRELSSLGRSDLRGAVGLARAASSLGETLTPALANNFEANSASKGAGMGKTGRSFVEIPRCCRLM